MRTVVKKDNDNNDIEVEYDEREYSKPNDYCSVESEEGAKCD